jgi:hypothetical protein
MSGRTRLVAMATAVALACLPTAARADFATGNILWRFCNDPDPTTWVSYGYCAGYMSGVADIMMQSIPVFGWRACLPETVSAAQATDVLKQFLNQHPEQRHYAAASLVAKALAEAFPCKQ